MATPSRDRLVDLVRPLAMVVVVLMHWVVQRVSLGPEGLRTENALHGPFAVAATWLLQVMPLFFIAGGFVNTLTYDRARQAGQTEAAFVGLRARRLLTPTVPVIVVVTSATTVAWLVGQPQVGRRVADHTANPWWFLVAYLTCVMVTPAVVRLHDRLGWWPVPLLLAVAVASNDTARRLLPGTPGLGDLNVLMVWLFCHQLGVLYARGTLSRVPRAGLAGTAALAVTGIVALVCWARYPDVTIGLADHPEQNLMPATLALVLLGTAQACLLALAAGAARRWRPSRRTEQLLGWGNLLLFPVFLWHVPAFFAFLGTGLAAPWLPSDEARYWALRPLAVLITAGLLAVLVAGAVQVERVWAGWEPVTTTARVVAGTGAGAVGCYLVWHRGLAVLGDDMAPDPLAVGALLLVMAGVLLVQRPGARPPRR